MALIYSVILSKCCSLCGFRNSDTEDDLSEIRALNSGKTSASGEAVGYTSNLQLPLNQKGMLFHLL